MEMLGMREWRKLKSTFPSNFGRNIYPLSTQTMEIGEDRFLEK